MRADTVTAGTWRTKLRKGGPWVPMKIEWCDGSPDPMTGDLMEDQEWRVTLNGSSSNPKTGNRWRVWDFWPPIFAESIDEREYQWMVADAEHARQYRQDDPKANPFKSIDLHTQPPIF